MECSIPPAGSTPTDISPKLIDANFAVSCKSNLFMPGIAGFIGFKDTPEARRRLEAMVSAMLHEPFYTSGAHSEPRIPLLIGWVTFDNSSQKPEPIWSRSRKLCLIILEESPRNESSDLRIGGRERLAALVEAFEQSGTACLRELNGWFCGVFIDVHERRIVLFNDRYGLNRICYYEGKDGFYFASEAKAILKVLPELRKMDASSIAEFLSCGCVLQNKTLFSKIFLLPGGSAWQIAPDRTTKKEYYFNKETWEDLPQLPSAEYYQKLREIWIRILPGYFDKAERGALSLTGGVDSRMILAWAPRGSLSCYSFGGMYHQCADVTLSQKVAALRGQRHQTILLDSSFFQEFPELALKTAYISDGTMDPTGTADLFVNRIARQIAPVRVTGLNGGEVLRRLVAFKPKQLSPGIFDDELYQLGQTAALTYKAEREGNVQAFITFKQSAWHLYSRLSIERSQLTLRSPYFHNELVALAFQAPHDCLTIEPALRIIAELAPELRRVGTDRAVLLAPIPLLSWLQHQWQEFTFKAEYAYDYGMPQWLAKVDGRLRSLNLQRLFIGRHKFYHYRLWYRDELSKYLKEILLDPKSQSRAYLGCGGIEAVVLRHTRGIGNFTTELHRLLTLELAHRTLLEQS
jgi:asparagine synthase (glutamine-hydrolysing)